MPDSMAEMLDRELQCEHLLDCFHGLTDLDRAVFETLVAADEPLTVDDVAERVDRERTTAYRSIQRLREADLLDRQQRTFEGGSYCHVFSPADPDAIADEMQRLLNDWYAEMGQLIAQFRTEYDTVDEPTAAEPPDH